VKMKFSHKSERPKKLTFCSQAKADAPPLCPPFARRVTRINYSLNGFHQVRSQWGGGKSRQVTQNPQRMFHFSPRNNFLKIK
jgi:hypothetical protein